MKNIVFFLFLVSSFLLKTQENNVKTGPIIGNFGKVYQIENPDLLLNTNTEYKVIFDIFTDKSKEGSKNPRLNTVARYLNMQGQQGVPIKNMKIVVVLHGSATKNVLNDKASQKYFKVNNLNSELVDELKKATVELYVFGQSYIASGFKLEEKSPNIKVALSALTALVEYQSKGYQIINFN